MFEPIKAILESLILHKFPISEMAELRGGSSFLRTALVRKGVSGGSHPPL
jgi:hypothetical protein